MSIERDADFESRRAAARAELAELPCDLNDDGRGRAAFFDAVYERAGDDEARVPWADLKAKERLENWLKTHAQSGKEAVDIACGLGDNAEALAAHGYITIAFDVVEDAISWAKRRFPNTHVDYQVCDLFNLPNDWHRRFDLVHECYTLQALSPDIIGETSEAICDLVAPGGTLLVYTRIREDGTDVDGPPWPLEHKNLDLPSRFGLTLVSDDRFDVDHVDRVVPHSFRVWQRPSE